MVVIHTGACEINNNIEKIVNPHTHHIVRVNLKHLIRSRVSNTVTLALHTR